MEKFTTLTAKVAPLPIQNIDTDMIIPKQFLKTIKRTGLREGLFYEMAYDLEGQLVADFVLNQPAYREAQILVAGDNFGCGSSREHAPWALLDFGIRCIIAPSFADIFYNNCFKNGMLPITLPQEKVDYFMQAAQDQKVVSVDLPAQTVSVDGESPVSFELDGFRKRCLLEGLDDIGLTLEHSGKIDAFEQTDAQARPWLYAA